MTTVQIALIPKLIPVFSGQADVRAAWGGRGSGKTRSFALMSAVVGYRHGKAGERGIILCARQFQNSLNESSLEEIKRAIESYSFLRDYYEIGDKYVRSKDGRIVYAFAGLDRNISSIKSMGRILLCWVDEAEPVTEAAWQTLIPTLREEGENWHCELWVTWNPLRENAPVEKRFRAVKDPHIKGVEINWRDNPQFPDRLNRAREADFTQRPEQYNHIWEGEYLQAVQGAYYQKLLLEAEQEGRITHVPRDPLIQIKIFWDIGGTGAKADATALWVAQFIGREIRVLDYYEAQGQPLSEHIGWMCQRGYDKALMVLPHDGATKDRVCNVSFESALQHAGFQTKIIPNQGVGAVKMRIEAVRRLFPAIWFNRDTTTAGRKALAWYHEKRDEQRNIGLGAEHDWASHGADSFGLMCVAYEQPNIQPRKNVYRSSQSSSTSWMAF
ncbi:PBSX family phage terminase large subunit [Bartonella schoenbuchensis]|uniref:Phage terminase, large subunit n=1 Tax=Bartonella schoenbuchensis m07a TaxID=1094496 RepID=N6UDF9_9HYPH|nr:phage terminase large subunit [Bartonella schoenbuchensis]ENN90594.1 phage terminase, large subunit [Bartonella schoenbuchensis m07a]